ncbi:hypothetical protein ARMGADRAFT_1031938 [Armillaria gallica]|uniref:Uncharacterized protein n=1 Tax=Armillaria gallica TaxID=47427 RepID=A0A2H3DK94_ARMGA|nr:hypothetical protein ARMGADRAFT_1031938 [Armillaria gallica]
MFNASSLRFCPECKHNICITFGGETNWIVHLKGHEHLKNAAPLRSNTITKFFPKKTSSSLSEKIPKPITETKTALTAPPLLLQQPIPPPSLDPALVLIEQIRDCTQFLPEAMLLGTLQDRLVHFSGDLCTEMEALGADEWEFVHDALNANFGYQAMSDNLKVDGALLEGKLSTVLMAMNELISFSHQSADTSVKGHDTNTPMAPINNASDVIDIDEFLRDGASSTGLSHQMAAEGVTDVIKESSFLEISCASYILEFPKGNHPLLHTPLVFTKIHSSLFHGPYL